MSWSLNPPRPCGRGHEIHQYENYANILKSTPPVWAGTKNTGDSAEYLNLKSTPPVWAGTAWQADDLDIDLP